MNPSIIAGLVRTLVAALAGFAAAKGIDITGLGTPEVTNAIALVGVAVWSAFSKKKVEPTAK